MLVPITSDLTGYVSFWSTVVIVLGSGAALYLSAIVVLLVLILRKL